ncbi:MAG TPA: hypothetical protein PLH19_12865 [Anaerolineae bacterium]|nr:hypothetical protein [Anaerolineae bacterium]HQH39410.1 hypothetical protein [Anaerolineae bacterium]
MDKVKQALLSIGRFLGVILLIDLALFIVVTISCQIGTRCTSTAWSERMFWVGIAAIICAAPAVLAMLSTSRSFSINPLTAGMDNAIAVDIIQNERKGMNKRVTFALRMGLIGAGCIAISALIDILTR